MDGTTVEAIYPRAVIEAVLATHPEKTDEAFESGDLTLLLHEDLSGGLVCFDERVALAGHDREDTLTIVDTGTPGAYEWVKAVYESYRQEVCSLFPDGYADCSP